MVTKRKQLSLSALFTLTLCAAFFLAGWMLPPPTDSADVRTPAPLGAIKSPGRPAEVLSIGRSSVALSAGRDDGIGKGRFIKIFGANGEIGTLLVSDCTNSECFCEPIGDLKVQPNVGDVYSIVDDITMWSTEADPGRSTHQ